MKTDTNRKKMRKIRFSANLGIAFAAVLWGTSFIMIRWGLAHIDSLLFVFLRFALATLLFLPFALRITENLGRLLIRKEIIAIGLFNAMAFLSQYLGQETTTAGLTALFVSFYVIFVPLLSPFFLKEKMSAKIVISTIIGLLGAFFVTTNLDFSGLSGEDIIGNILALVASIAWTGYILVSKKYLDKDEKLSGIDVFFGSITWTSVFLVLGLPFMKTPIIRAYEQTFWQAIVALIYLAVVCTIGAFGIYLYSLKQVQAGESTIVLLLEIIVAWVLELILHFFMPEIWTVDTRPWTIIGTVMILSAVVFVSVNFNDLRKKMRKKNKKAAGNNEISTTIEEI